MNKGESIIMLVFFAGFLIYAVNVGNIIMSILFGIGLFGALSMLAEAFAD